jgi:spore coat protein A
MKTVLPFEKKLLLVISFLFAGQLFSQQLPLLDPVLHPKFVNPLPFPSVLQPNSPGGNQYTVEISQFDQDLGIVDALGMPKMTTVWGYNNSYPGPTIEARSGDGDNEWYNGEMDQQAPQRTSFCYR